MLLNQCKNPARVSTKCAPAQLLLLGCHSSIAPCRMISGLQKSSCDTEQTISAWRAASCSLVARMSAAVAAATTVICTPPHNAVNTRWHSQHIRTAFQLPLKLTPACANRSQHILQAHHAVLALTCCYLNQVLHTSIPSIFPTPLNPHAKLLNSLPYDILFIPAAT
jgi:hypothetical protein